MPELEEHELDAMLQGHFRQQLEPHVGHAHEKWERQVVDRRRMRLRWTWGLIGAAAAACIAAIVLLRPLYRGEGSVALADGEMTITPISSATLSRDLDEGTIVIDDDVPVRYVVREVVRTAEWFDRENQARIVVGRPREELVLIEMPKY